MVVLVIAFSVSVEIESAHRETDRVHGQVQAARFYCGRGFEKDDMPRGLLVVGVAMFNGEYHSDSVLF